MFFVVVCISLSYRARTHTLKRIRTVHAFAYVRTSNKSAENTVHKHKKKVLGFGWRMLVDVGALGGRGLLGEGLKWVGGGGGW